MFVVCLVVILWENLAYNSMFYSNIFNGNNLWHFLVKQPKDTFWTNIHVFLYTYAFLDHNMLVIKQVIMANIKRKTKKVNFQDAKYDWKDIVAYIPGFIDETLLMNFYLKVTIQDL